MAVNPYTHLVRTKDGRQFSIHHSAADAQARADKIGGTFEPWTPTETHRYDYLDALKP